jgi:excisionase family DNA binding protein
MNTQLAYTIAEVCIVGRTGRTSIYDAINKGELQARKRGRRTLILADELRRWLESLPAVEPKRQFPEPFPSGAPDKRTEAIVTPERGTVPSDAETQAGGRRPRLRGKAPKANGVSRGGRRGI